MSKGNNGIRVSMAATGTDSAEHTARLAGLLQQEIHKQRLSYEDLAAQLAGLETPVYSAAQLERLIATGKISAGLLLRIFACLGIEKLELNALKNIEIHKEKGKP